MENVQQVVADDAALIEKLKHGYQEILRELRKVIIAQNSVVEQVMICMMVGAHSMITGVPGLAKTLLIKTLASVLDLKFKRIQFTPDLMPADIGRAARGDGRGPGDGTGRHVSHGSPVLRAGHPESDRTGRDLSSA